MEIRVGGSLTSHIHEQWQAWVLPYNKDCQVRSMDMCFVGESFRPEHHQCQQGPVCRVDWVPAPPRRPAKESAAAKGPPGFHPHAGPQ